MVQLTSAEAAKILKKLNEELSSVISKEEQSKCNKVPTWNCGNRVFKESSQEGLSYFLP